MLNNQRTYSNININLINCYFQRTTIFIGENTDVYSKSGSIIFCYNSNSFLNINECIFYNCGCSGYGGAIFFYGSESNLGSIINKICAYNCFTNLFGQFCYISVKDNTNYKNNFNFSSILKCNNNISFGYQSIRLRNGDQEINSINLTFNECLQTSGILFEASNKLIFQYSTIFNNSVKNSHILHFETYASINIISNCNIINNFSPSKGVCYCIGNNYYFQYCYFNNNFNQIFFVFSYTVYLENSIIIHFLNPIFSGSGNSITTFSNSIFNINTNIPKISLNHLNTFFCLTYNTNINLFSFQFFYKKYLFQIWFLFSLII